MGLFTTLVFGSYFLILEALFRIFRWLRR